MSGERSNPSTPALPGQGKSSMLAPIKTPDTSWPLGGNDHEKRGLDRRDFLKSAVVAAGVWAGCSACAVSVLRSSSRWPRRRR